MVKKKLLLWVIALSIIGLIIVGFVCYWVGEQKGYIEIFVEPEKSPSGDFVLEQMFGYDHARYVKFCIESNNGDKEFVSDDMFYIRFNTIIKWGDNDTLWVYSGDIGTFYWEFIENTWVKRTADSESIKFAPDEIQKIWSDLG